MNRSLIFEDFDFKEEGRDLRLASVRMKVCGIASIIRMQTVNALVAFSEEGRT